MQRVARDLHDGFGPGLAGVSDTGSNGRMIIFAAHGLVATHRENGEVRAI
ncbi:hypothetical protein [Nonomuraea maritima]